MQNWSRYWKEQDRSGHVSLSKCPEKVHRMSAESEKKQNKRRLSWLECTAALQLRLCDPLCKFSQCRRVEHRTRTLIVRLDSCMHRVGEGINLNQCSFNLTTAQLLKSNIFQTTLPVALKIISLSKERDENLAGRWRIFFGQPWRRKKNHKMVRSTFTT